MTERKLLICCIVLGTWLCTRVETILQCSPNYLTHLSSFNDKAVSDYHISSLVLDDLVKCFLKCDEDTRCVSYQYNNGSRNCSLFAVGFKLPSGTMNPVSDEPGAKVYLMNDRLGAFGMECASVADCNMTGALCHGGTCKCPRVYSYDPGTKACVQQCSQYGDTFSYFGQFGLFLCETRQINVPNPKACMEGCRDEGGFVCINAEYNNITKSCKLCDTAWFSVPSEERGPVSESWFYQRNCAL